MTAIYRLTKLLASHRGGMNAAIDAEIRGIAKTNDESPYTIANEVIAARLGQTLGLPIPSGVIAEDTGKKLYYLSLDVSREGKRLPPVIAADFVGAESWLAAGCVIFDVLIANGDRNATNLSRDPAFNPPRVTVFDHGHALLGTNPPTGLERLELARGRLGCVDDTARIASDHILIKQPLNSGHLEAWCQRVGAVPDYVFGDICAEVAANPALHVDRATSEKVRAWLIERAAGIGPIVCENREAFPAVQWGLWGPGGAR